MLTLDFLITSLIVVLIPGSGVILTISTALVAGKRASLFTACLLYTSPSPRDS